MEVTLIVVGGKASSREIALKLPSTVGRSREADLTVAHPMISRRHCELFESSGLLMVRDLGSLNGTFIGDQRVGEAPLPPEASFTIGPLTFSVRYRYSGDLAALPAVVPPTSSQQPAAAGRTAEAAGKRTVKTEPVAPQAASQPADEEDLDDLELAEPLEMDSDFELEEQPAMGGAGALAADEDEPVANAGKKPAAPRTKPASAEEEPASDAEEDAFNDFLKGLQ